MGHSIEIKAVGSIDAYIIKLDSFGVPVWAKSFGRSNNDVGYGIAVDTLGNSYTTGSFKDSMIVGNTTLTSAGQTDIFIIKLDSFGTPIWAKNYGGISYDNGLDIAVDTLGNSYTTGNFAGTMTVGNITLTTAGANDMFIIKLDSFGVPLWAKRYGGPNGDAGTSIAVDASGNSYSTGYFQGTMTVGSTNLTSVGGRDIFIIKLDSSGSPIWAVGYGSSIDDEGKGIQIGALGSVYTCGY